ncbi:MAG TPA: hypothetical protein DEQ34_04730 [Balneolaceae bacterium]|nr:hypothetical protein [Balneolaceae bacterium]
MKKAIVVWVFSLLVMSSSFAQTGVTKLPSLNGGNFQNVVEFRDTVYTTSFGGDVFFSVDGGVNWAKDSRFAADGAPAFAFMNYAFLVADEVNDQLYLAGRSGLTIHSTGATQTPTTMPEFFGSRGVVGDIIVSDTALYASYFYTPMNLGGIIKSTDKGVNWEILTEENAFFWDLVALPGGKLFGVKGFSFGNSIFISDETASNFTELTDPVEFLGSITDADYTSDGKLVLSTNTNGVFTSDDLGENWTALIDTNAFEFHELSNGDWLISTTSGKVMVSSDKGSSWSTFDLEVDSTPFNEQGVKSFVELGDGTLLGSMVWGDLPNYSFTNTSAGMIRSTDGGLSWTVSNEGLSSLNTAQLFYFRADNELYSYVIGTGVLKWNATTEEWEVQGSEDGPDLSELQSYINAVPGWQAVSEILTFSKNTETGEVWVVTNGLTIKNSSSTGEWGVYEQAPNPFLGPTSLHIMDNGTGYVHETLGIGQGIYTSTDGVNWSLVSGSPLGYNITRFEAIDSYLIIHDGYALDGEAGILISDDDGASFTNISLDEPAYYQVTGMFAVEYDNELLLTVNRLEPSIERYDLDAETTSVIDFDTDVELSDYRFGEIIQTPNGGILVDVRTLNSFSGQYDHYGYFHLNEDTGKWIMFDPDLFPAGDATEIVIASENQVAMRFDNEIYTVSVQGVSTASEELSGSEIPSEFKVLQNYPNPFNPSTTLRFQLNEAAVTSLKVYAINGAQVASMKLGNLSAGIHEVPFNASALPSGLYLYSIEANGISKTGRMTLIK